MRLAGDTAELLSRLRRESTRVHAITNAAAQVLTANLILAAGGTPSLTIAPEEVTAFASRADALLVNLGTLDGDRRAAIPWGDRRREGAGQALGARSGLRRRLAAPARAGAALPCRHAVRAALQPRRVRGACRRAGGA